MIKNIFTLTLNDLAISLKNKTIFLIVFIPLFVFFTLKLVDTKNTEFHPVKLGLIEKENYSPVVLKSIQSAPDLFKIAYVENAELGKSKVKDKSLDALLLTSEALIVLKKESITSLTTIESFQALQKSIEGKNHNWITQVIPLQEESMQKQSFPTWILMLVLLVGFIIMPSQVAEEKEKKLLLSLLQTPMREIEWLLAKIALSMILISSAIFLLHLLGGFSIGLNFSYIIFILIGSFCFSSYGILLGFLCRNQASAKILGVVFYLPHLLPSALSDYSKKLEVVAPILPSYQFYESIKAILFDHTPIYGLIFESIYLLAVGLITFFFSYQLIKKRWLMA
jgi:ABC-2 type transport system permease protein